MKFWDVASGKQKTAGEVTNDPLRCAAFSPDGKVLATGHFTGALTLWDTASGKPSQSFKGQHSNSIRSVVFSPDGKLLVTSGQDQKANVWETATWTVVRSLVDLPQPVLGSAISRDGKLLALALGGSPSGGNDGGVWIYDLDTLGTRVELSGLKTTVWSVAFSPDGKTLAACNGRSLRLWDPTTGEPRSTLDVPHAVRVLAFSPDGKLLLSAGKESAGANGKPAQGVTTVWDLSTLRPKATIKGHGELILGASFSPDGRLLATGSVAAPEVRVWEVAKLPAVTTLVAKSAASAPNRSVSTKGSSASFVERPSPANQGSSDSVTLALAYSPDGRMLALGGEDKMILLRDAATGEVLKTLSGHTDIVAGLAFSPDSQTLASASYDKTVRLWDVAGGGEKAVLQGHKNWVLAVAYAPDGKTLRDGELRQAGEALGRCRVRKRPPVWRATVPRCVRSPSRPTARRWPPAAATGWRSSGTSPGGASGRR